MRIVFWPRGHFAERQVTAALVALPVELATAQSLPEAVAAIGTADVLVTSDCDPQSAAALVAALEQSPVRWFQFLSAGRERLQAAGLPERLELFGIGDALAPAIGEHGMALALALYRGLPQTLAAQQQGSWSASHRVSRRGLKDDTALIVGLGAIGADLARRAKLFGMQVIAVARTPAPYPDVDEVLPMSELLAALPRAGVVFLSVALTDDTRHLIAAKSLAHLRRGAFLINLARGGLVDQDALVAALASGALGGAGIDVTDPEPLPPEHPLWSAPNLIITPHVAVAGSVLSADRLAAQVAKNMAGLVERAGRRS